MERDIRTEQMREAIDHAARIWEKGLDNLERIRYGFNQTVSKTQSDREISK